MFDALINTIEEQRKNDNRFWQFIILLKDAAWNGYVFVDCFIARHFAHYRWLFVPETKLDITPVIVMSEGRIDVKKRFVASYNKFGPQKRPIVFLDTFGIDIPKELEELLKDLDPEKIIRVPKTMEDRVDNFMDFMSGKIFKITLPILKDGLLFFEDDIIFSRHFRDVLKKISFGHRTGLISLYTPMHEYKALNKRGPIKEISANKFYGTQAVIFPKKAVEGIAMIESFPPDLLYDHLWANHLSSNGFILEATDGSYAQHIGLSNSRFQGRTCPHYSKKFIN